MSHETPSSDFTPPEIEEVASLLPAYEVLSFIAKGGMGAVYLANQKSLDREVAIKVLPRHFAADEDFRLSFETEAKSMAKLNHPNLIGIYDFGQVGDLLYIIMEVAKGESLYYYAYGKTFAPADASRIITAISDGLASAHNHGILHRDIKPANILMDLELSPKIGDFGLARPVGDHEHDSAYGTPGYTAPEVVNNPAAVDESTDLYSVGVILYELLTGKIPEPIYTSAASLVGCDPAYDRIIQKAIHPTPAMRYRSAKDFSEAINNVITQKSTSNPLLTPPSPSLQASPSQNRLVTPTPGTHPANSAAAAPEKQRLSPPAPAAKSKSPFARNIIIIAILLGTIYFAWEGLQRNRAQQATAKKETQQKGSLVGADQNKTSAKKSAKPLPPTPTANTELPLEALARLRIRLRNGIRSEMPKQSFTEKDRAYLFIKEKMTWHQAHNFCADHGGNLATPAKAADLSKLCSKLGAADTIWLGAGTSGKGKWSWIDGSHWESEIRPTSKAAYVTVDDTTVLKPQPEGNKNSFFIEWRMDGSTPATIEKQLARCGDFIRAGKLIFPAGTISYGNRYYLPVKYSCNWTTANILAQSSKGHLACSSTSDEHTWILQFIASYLTNDEHCWTGGLRQKNQPWKWITGEPWKAKLWEGTIPENLNNALTASAVNANQQWKTYPGNDIKSHFIIEWSSDASKHTTVKVNSPIEEHLVPLRKICLETLQGIHNKYDTRLSENIRAYEKMLHSYQDQLSEPELSAQALGLANMVSHYPEGRIPKEISRTGMAPKASKILDAAIEEQDSIHIQYLTDAEVLRQKYRSKLKKTKKALIQKGLKADALCITEELTKTTYEVEAFIKDIFASH